MPNLQVDLDVAYNESKNVLASFKVCHLESPD